MTTTITRRFKKQRTHVMFSPTLQGVLDELIGDQQKSGYVEAATWAMLNREFTDDELAEAVERVQTTTDAPRLDQSREYQLPR